MAIAIGCPKCNVRIAVAETAVGRMTKCPACGSQVAVPAVEKKCASCGTNVVGRKRVKDATGTYYCEACWAARIASLRDQREQMDAGAEGSPAVTSLEYTTSHGLTEQEDVLLGVAVVCMAGIVEWGLMARDPFGILVRWVLGGMVAAILLRAAAYWVAKTHVQFWRAFSTQALALQLPFLLASSLGSWIVGLETEPAYWVLSLVVSFFACAGICAWRTRTSVGRAALIALVLYALVGTIYVGISLIFYYGVK